MRQRFIAILIAYIIFNCLSVYASPCENVLIRVTSLDNRDRWQWDAWGRGDLVYQGLVLKKKDYLAFKEAAQLVANISKDAPVIGAGRSPAPITTVLSLFKNHGVANIAMSSFRSRPRSNNSSAELPEHYKNKQDKFEPLTQEMTTKLFEYFDKSLLEFLKNKSGTIFLIDVGESGASLFALKAYLDLYAAARGLKINFDTILLTTPFFSENVDIMAKYYGVQTHKIVVSDNNYVNETLSSSTWERFAEFNSFEFQQINKLGRTSFYDSFSQEYVELGQGEKNDWHKYLKVAVQANMLMDSALPADSLAFTAIDPHVEGVYWDQQNRTFKNKNNKIVKLSTGN